MRLASWAPRALSLLLQVSLGRDHNSDGPWCSCYHPTVTVPLLPSHCSTQPDPNSLLRMWKIHSPALLPMRKRYGDMEIHLLHISISRDMEERHPSPTAGSLEQAGCLNSSPLLPSPLLPSPLLTSPTAGSRDRLEPRIYIHRSHPDGEMGISPL